MVRSLVLLFLCTIYVYGLPQRSLLGGHAGCVKPGLCVAPNTTYKAVSSGPTPGIQWEISGGFCGSWSIQQAALAHGAWISQDLIRKANIDWVGPKVMHGDSDLGYEILPINVGFTAGHLKLRYEEWDYNTTKPQAAAYKAWIKKHLVAGSPIVWFPMCKGDHGDGCYGGADCPNGGNLDHSHCLYTALTACTLLSLPVHCSHCLYTALTACSHCMYTQVWHLLQSPSERLDGV